MDQSIGAMSSLCSVSSGYVFFKIKSIFLLDTLILQTYFFNDNKNMFFGVT